MEDFEDLGGCVDESLFRLSSLTPSSFLDFPADKKCLVIVTDTTVASLVECHLVEWCIIKKATCVQGSDQLHSVLTEATCTLFT